MKTKIFFAAALSVIILYGCNPGESTEVAVPANYSGQYQSVPYQSSQSSDPLVVILLAQEGNKVTGTGSWNGITFNLNGTIIEKHLLITFMLKGTNLGEINGTIDSWIGHDKSLAGGYQLWNDNTVLSGAIRFKQSFPITVNTIGIPGFMK